MEQTDASPCEELPLNSNRLLECVAADEGDLIQLETPRASKPKCSRPASSITHNKQLGKGAPLTDKHLHSGIAAGGYSRLRSAQEDMIRRELLRRCRPELERAGLWRSLLLRAKISRDAREVARQIWPLEKDYELYY